MVIHKQLQNRSVKGEVREQTKRLTSKGKTANAKAADEPFSEEEVRERDRQSTETLENRQKIVSR